MRFISYVIPVWYNRIKSSLVSLFYLAYAFGSITSTRVDCDEKLVIVYVHVYTCNINANCSSMRTIIYMWLCPCVWLCPCSLCTVHCSLCITYYFFSPRSCDCESILINDAYTTINISGEKKKHEERMNEVVNDESASWHVVNGTYKTKIPIQKLKEAVNRTREMWMYSLRAGKMIWQWCQGGASSYLVRLS